MAGRPFRPEGAKLKSQSDTVSVSGVLSTFRRLFSVTAISVVATVAVGCSSGLDLVQSASGFEQPTGSEGSSDNNGQPTATTSNKTSTDTKSTTGSRPYADVLKLSIVDIQEFWRLKMPEVFGQAYTPIPNSSMHPYDSRNLPPACGREQPTYKEIAGNAFYCSDSNYIAWDDGQLFPTLAKEFGPFAVALVLAHEWGHAIQGQLGLVDRATKTVVLEQQADCFAGAWTRRIADGDSGLLELGDSSLDGALAGLLAFRDEPGMLGSDDNGAHGSGFDRVRAFRDGFEKSLSDCATYTEPTKDLELTEFPFSLDELDTGGNMKMSDLASYLHKDLNAYFTYRYSGYEPMKYVKAVNPKGDAVECDGESVDGGSFDKGVYLCEKDSTVYVDSDVASSLYQATGDFAISILFGDGWARRAQLDAGMSADELSSDDAYKQRLCMIGGYAGSLVDDRREGTITVPDRKDFSISGGDLDEAIGSIMKLNAGGSLKNDSDAMFKTIGEFQKGVIDGPTACE